MRDGIGQISLFELELLGDLGSHSSLRSLGRQKRLEPPHLSKILTKLEKKLQTNLIKRSPKGILLTPQGLRLVQIAREMIPLREALISREAYSVEERLPLVTIAATRFMATHLIAPVIESLRSSHPGLRFRLLDMAPDEVEPAAIRSACEAVVSIGELKLTRAWETERIGNLTWGLYASSRHPLAVKTTEEQVARYPFLVPTYWRNEGFEKGDDGCPLPWSRRKLGDESSSVLTAVEIVRHSPDQLLFAPRLVLNQLINKGDFKEIRVAEWKRVERPIYLSLKADEVSKSLQKRILSSLALRLR